MASVAKALADPIRVQLVDVCESTPARSASASSPAVRRLAADGLAPPEDAARRRSRRRRAPGPLGLLLRQPRSTGGAEHMAVLRPHLALTVTDVERSIPSTRRCSAPSRRRSGPATRSSRFAKPALNFTLTQGERDRSSARSTTPASRSQTTDDVLAAKERLVAAGLAAFDEMDTTCCYARQDKIWVRDPDGTPWEVFVTHEDTTSRTRARVMAAGDGTLRLQVATVSRARLRVTRAPAQRSADALPPLGGRAVVAVRVDLTTDQEQWPELRRRPRGLVYFGALVADGRRGADHDEVHRAGRRRGHRGGGDLPRHPAGRRGAAHAVLRALPGRGRRGAGRDRGARRARARAGVAPRSARSSTWRWSRHTSSSSPRPATSRRRSASSRSTTWCSRARSA